MSKYKVKDSIWFVLAEGIKIYFSNIDKFFLYMLFPVFGQVIGIVLTFALTLGFSEKIITRMDSISVALLMILLLAVPGLLIFAKAFWDYMVAYVALNSMTEGAVTTGKVYDFQSHNEVATRRTFTYVLFLLSVGVLSSLGSSIFLIIPGFILWIYLILVYQVFTFEPELSIPDCFKRSFILVKGNWFRTFLLLAILSFFSIFIITEGITVVFDYLNLTDRVASLFSFFANALPLATVNEIFTYWHIPVITSEMISRSIFYSALSFIVMGLTLPIRSICWTLWYKNLDDISLSRANSKVQRSVKKSSKRERFEDRED